MPMIWNHEAEAKLLSNIFTVCDVKVSAEQLKELAEKMGPDCTPKAITHRISKFRNAKKTTNGDAGGTTASPKPRAPAKRTVTKSSTPASKRGGKKASPSPSASGAEESPARPKRSTPKRNYAQMAGDGTDSEDGDKGADGKYIKTEAGEEEPRDSPTEGIEFNFS